MSADISKMFREVSLHPDDRDLHRYVTKDSNGMIKEHRMTRLTFGVSASPFLATQVLRKLSKDYQVEYPEASELVLTSFYVDDCLTGADTVQEAVSIWQSLNEMLSKGSMNLRKWRSNSPDLKSTIPEELLEKESVKLITAPEACHKALGVHWDTVSDTLHIATPKLQATDSPTKRQVLSDIARTFDALGWFSPVTITLKILLQRIWHLKIEWNQVIPNDLSDCWRTWRDELYLVTQTPIPRCYYIKGKKLMNVQLHGFCDASQDAFAGVVHLRATYNSDVSTSTALVIAKARVAPVKTTTIPKLELCSTVLLSKLIASTREELQIDLSNVFAWSDSTTSLSWIHTSPHQLKTYVANRVVAIINHVPAQHWRHVPSADNPADLGSRGCTASTLTESKLWWTGPPWLKQGPDNWPLQERQRAAVSELKDSAIIIQPPPEELLNLSERYSSYVKIINVLSWLLRFVNNTRKEKSDRILDAILTVTEQENAEVKLYKMHQSCLMRTELTSFTAGKPVPKSSPLPQLNPFLDKNGVVRVGGRLTQSELLYGQRHPVIIHHKGPLARLLILHLHRKHMHAGPTDLMAILSRNHYIIGSRRFVREITGH